MNPFRRREDGGFNARDVFGPEHLPDPGPFLEDATVLTGRAHLATHRLAEELFEVRGVYDATFGYNLAELNRDRRHPDAGFRYAEDGEELRAEFTPTTPFCPQSQTLTVGAFRAWNGLSDRHGYEVVRVGIREHHAVDEINLMLARLADHYNEMGEIDLPSDERDGESTPLADVHDAEF